MTRIDTVRERLELWLGRRLGGLRPAPSGAVRSQPHMPASVELGPEEGVALPAAVAVENDATAMRSLGAEDVRAALVASRAQLIEAIADPVMLIDADGSILHCNAAVGDLFPRARVGQQVSHSSRSPELLSAIDGVLATGERAVVHLVDRVPVKRRMSAIVTRIGGDTGDSGAGEAGVPAALITFRDFTEQERHNQMRSDFIANASHELRTPLASLRGFIETLQGPARNDPAAQDRFISMMAREASRMSRLIDDLLTLSRVEMRAHLPPRGLVDLNELAEFVAFTLEPVAELDTITVSAAPSVGDATVRGDREELIQVFQNLVHNAIKYGRPGGRVEIRVAEHVGKAGRTRLAVTVTDDGEGIAEQHLPRLTERFYRVSTAQSRAKGGTGLGLAIVKHIVSRHRGDLEIRSEVGKGSTFMVVLDAVVGGGSSQTVDSK